MTPPSSKPQASSPPSPNPGDGACWNTIGVRGDRSCPKLAEHAHCRKCPTYSSAAASLLDRPLWEEYIEEATQHFAQPKRAGEHRTESVTIFRLGTEWLALPTSTVTEVAATRMIHSLPHRRNGAVLGLANIRGELLICVSLARLLGVQAAAASEAGSARKNRLLVVREAGVRVVFPVDEVHGIHRFPPSETKPVAATIARATSAHTRSMIVWEGHAVGCLDETRVFHAVNRSLT